MSKVVETTNQELLLGGSPQGGLWLRLAQVISLLSNPLLLALPLYLVVALASAPTRIQGVLWWVVTALGVSAAPFVFVWRGVRLAELPLEAPDAAVASLTHHICHGLFTDTA